MYIYTASWKMIRRLVFLMQIFISLENIWKNMNDHFISMQHHCNNFLPLLADYFLEIPSRCTALFNDRLKYKAWKCVCLFEAFLVLCSTLSFCFQDSTCHHLVALFIYKKTQNTVKNSYSRSNSFIFYRINFTWCPKESPGIYVYVFVLSLSHHLAFFW